MFLPLKEAGVKWVLVISTSLRKQAVELQKGAKAYIQPKAPEARMRKEGHLKTYKTMT